MEFIKISDTKSVNEDYIVAVERVGEKTVLFMSKPINSKNLTEVHIDAALAERVWQILEGDA